MVNKQGRTTRRRTVIAAAAATGGLVAVMPAFATQQGSVDAFMGRYFAAQDAALMPSTADVSSTLSSLYGAGQSATVLRNYQVSTALGFHRWVAAHGDRYRSIRTAYTVRSLRQAGNSATATVDTTTTMLWSPGISAHPAFTKEKAAEMAELARAGKLYGATDVITSKIATTQVMTFARTAAGWRVSRDNYSDALNLEVAADHVSHATAARPIATPVVRTQAAATTGMTKHSMSYNRGAVQSYADKYWQNYNTPKYLKYGDTDCANFVSQSISDPNGGDAPWDSKWYYNWYETDPNKASPIAWRYVPSLHSYLLNSPEGSTYDDATQVGKGSPAGTLSTDKASMQRGDVFMYDWSYAHDGTLDHTSVGVAAATDGATLVDAHTNNRYHVRYDLGTASGTTIYLLHMHNTLYYNAPST